MHTTKAEVHWGDVALGITPPYSYCHTGYIPSVTVAVSHLVYTGHWVYTLGILGTYPLDDMPISSFDDSPSSLGLYVNLLMMMIITTIWRI